MLVQDEKLLPAVVHDVLAEVLYKMGDGGRLAVLAAGGHGDVVFALV